MFSRLAKAMKPKSVKVSLETPKTFNWSHSSLPVTVELNNRAEEPVTIESIDVQVREKKENEESSFNHWDQGMVVSTTHEMGTVLAPGETTRVDIDMPTSVSEAMDEDQPGWMKLAGKALDVASRAKGGSNWFEVRALVHTEGSKNPRTVVGTIGGGGVFTFSSR